MSNEGEEGKYGPRTVAIGKDAICCSSTYFCRNDKCTHVDNGGSKYIIFIRDGDEAVCPECGEDLNKLTEHDIY